MADAKLLQLKAANQSVLASQKSAQAESMVRLKAEVDMQKISLKSTNDLAKIHTKAALSTKASASAANDNAAALDGEATATEGLSSSMSSLGPEAEIAAKAIAYAAETLWDWSLAAIAAAQRRDALVATFNALGVGGEKTLATTSRLAASLPYLTSQVNAWAKSLAMAGAQGPALEKGVKAIAASAAITQTGGEAAENLIKKWSLMAETGQKVKLDRRTIKSLGDVGVQLDDIAKALGTTKEKLGGASIDAAKLGDAMQSALIAKGGPALEALGLTWDSIKAKFDEGLGSIFSGMSEAVRPLMVEIKNLFGEFNKGGSSVTVLGGLMKALLVPIFKVAAAVVHALHTAFLYVAIGLLKVAIFISPVVNWFRKLYQNALVLKGIVFFFKALAVIIGIVAIAAALMVLPFIVLGVIAWAAIALVVAAFFWLEGVISEAVSAIGDALSEAGTALLAWENAAYDAATNFISGLVDGISSGAGAVVAAVEALASSALSSFKAVLGIASPSKVMMQMGGHMTTGLASGLDAGQGRVGGSAAALGGAAAAGVAGGASGGKSGGMSVTFASGAIQINGAGKSGLEITQEMLASALELLAAQQGLAQGA